MMPMLRLMLAMFLCVVAGTSVSAQQPKVVRQKVYARHVDTLPMTPCGVHNTSPECLKNDSLVKARSLREDYEMIVAQTASCLVDLSKHKVLMGRDALPNYPADDQPLAEATTLAIGQRNACAERLKQVPDTSEVPPPVKPPPVASQQRILVKKP